MKKVFNRKYLSFFGLILLLIVAFVVARPIYGAWREERLIQQYLNDPERKQFAEWLRTDQKDLASNPERARRIGITMDMGLQWYNLMQYDLAAKWWKKGLKIEHNNDIGWYNLGNAYRDSRHYWRAENAYEESMEVATEGEIDACLALGEMYKYAYNKKKDKEDDVYLKCLKKHTNNRDLIARLAIYYRDNDDIPNATIYFDKLYSIEPTFEVSEELRALRIKSQQIN